VLRNLTAALDAYLALETPRQPSEELEGESGSRGFGGPACARIN
jgi:hypothetical protein